MTPMNRRGFVAAAAGAAAAAVSLNPQSAAAFGVPRTGTTDAGDFEAADRGFIAALEPGVVKNSAGTVVWDNDVPLP
ncbi:hypothetical protein [Streptomyces sp. R41]|uniref:Uncharacterized protein n=1 Tax=Streptomyces sp. R41 TaxID=3238632 RepID=A0AB39RDJ4_9ACTN